MSTNSQLQLELMRELGQIEARAGHAADLLIRAANDESKSRGCSDCGHGHTSDQPDSDGSMPYIRTRDDFRRMLVSMGSGLLAGGASQLDCKAVGKDSVSAGCCRAWNKLLDDLSKGGDGWAASDEVAVVCGGWA